MTTDNDRLAEELFQEIRKGFADPLAESMNLWLDHDRAGILLSLLRSVPAQGMVMVPREPTEAMLAAAFDHMDDDFSLSGDEGIVEAWKAMLAAYESVEGK
jgi:hypothetical protein